MNDEPWMVYAGNELRKEFQRGSDKGMLDILITNGLVRELVNALMSASDRTLTYAAPQIADLAKRVGYLSVHDDA